MVEFVKITTAFFEKRYEVTTRMRENEPSIDQLRSDFETFLDKIVGYSSESLTAARLAEAPFDRIYATTQLIWMRDLINSAHDERSPLIMGMIPTLEIVYLNKGSLWSVTEGVPIIMNGAENVTSQDVEYFVKQATRAARVKDLKATYSDPGEWIVRPLDLVEWALRASAPINQDVLRAIRAGMLGSIRTSHNGFPSKRTTTIARNAALQKAAEELKRKNPRWSKNQIADEISKSRKFGLSRDRINHIIDV